MTNPTPNILQRLNAVMQEVDYIQREQKQGMRYKIVSHDKVTGLVRPALVKHGVVYWPSSFDVKQSGNRTELCCQVVFANMDDKNDYIVVDTLGYGIDDQDKGPGKAISYAVKYALLKALGLETGDDPDLEQDVEHKHDRAPHIQSAPPPDKKPPPTYDRNPIVRDEFMRVCKGIKEAGEMGTLEDLAFFWKANAKTINALPADWRAEIEQIKNEAKAALEAKAA
jgi:hypothetical protein